MGNREDFENLIANSPTEYDDMLSKKWLKAQPASRWTQSPELADSEIMNQIERLTRMRDLLLITDTQYYEKAKPLVEKLGLVFDQQPIKAGQPAIVVMRDLTDAVEIIQDLLEQVQGKNEELDAIRGTVSLAVEELESLPYLTPISNALFHLYPLVGTTVIDEWVKRKQHESEGR